MFFGSGDPEPKKIEWDEVKEIWTSGDVKEVTFVRNEYEGEITIKSDSLSKYKSRFKDGFPKESPHFYHISKP